MQRGHNRGILAFILGIQDAMPDEEIDQDERAVGFEFACAEQAEDLGGWVEREEGDFAVGGGGSEGGGEEQVVGVPFEQGGRRGSVEEGQSAKSEQGLTRLRAGSNRLL